MIIPFRTSKGGSSLRGEIFEAPPIYRFFQSPYDVKVWASTAIGMLALLWPFLLLGGTDVVLYSMGLCVLVWAGKQAYEHRAVKREVDEFIARIQ